MLDEKTWAKLKEADYYDVERFLKMMKEERFVNDAPKFLDNVSLWVDTSRSEQVGPLTFQQVAAFMQEVGEPPPMFAEGLLPAKSLVLWTGKAKWGKSLACYQLMTDVATGQPIFGNFTVNSPGAVLYVGMEDGKHEVNRRLRNFGLTVDDTELQVYVNTDLRDYGKAENIIALKNYIDTMETPPVLIVIDTLTESLDGVRDWNNRNEVKRAFRALRQFAQEVCTVIGIVHNVKGDASERDSGDEIAGSLAVLSSSDGYLSCYKRRKLPDGNLQLFVRGGGRGGISPQEFIIEMDTESYHWRWLDTDEVETAKRQEQAEQRKSQWERVEIAVKWKEGQATLKDIAQHINISETYARTIIGEMVKADRLEKVGMVKNNGAGKPAPLYGLVEEIITTQQLSPCKGSVIIPSGGVGGSDADNRAKSAVDDFFNDAPETEEVEGEYDIV